MKALIRVYNVDNDRTFYLPGIIISAPVKDLENKVERCTVSLYNGIESNVRIDEIIVISRERYNAIVQNIDDKAGEDNYGTNTSVSKSMLSFSDNPTRTSRQDQEYDADVQKRTQFGELNKSSMKKNSLSKDRLSSKKSRSKTNKSTSDRGQLHTEQEAQMDQEMTSSSAMNETEEDILNEHNTAEIISEPNFVNVGVTDSKLSQQFNISQSEKKAKQSLRTVPEKRSKILHFESSTASAKPSYISQRTSQSIIPKREKGQARERQITHSNEQKLTTKHGTTKSIDRNVPNAMHSLVNIDSINETNTQESIRGAGFEGESLSIKNSNRVQRSMEPDTRNVATISKGSTVKRKVNPSPLPSSDKVVPIYIAEQHRDMTSDSYRQDPNVAEEVKSKITRQEKPKFDRSSTKSKQTLQSSLVESKSSKVVPIYIAEQHRDMMSDSHRQDPNVAEEVKSKITRQEKPKFDRSSTKSKQTLQSSLVERKSTKPLQSLSEERRENTSFTTNQEVQKVGEISAQHLPSQTPESKSKITSAKSSALTNKDSRQMSSKLSIHDETKVRVSHSSDKQLFVGTTFTDDNAKPESIAYMEDRKGKVSVKSSSQIKDVENKKGKISVKSVSLGQAFKNLEEIEHIESNEYEMNFAKQANLEDERNTMDSGVSRESQIVKDWKFESVGTSSIGNDKISQTKRSSKSQVLRGESYNKNRKSKDGRTIEFDTKAEMRNGSEQGQITEQQNKQSNTRAGHSRSSKNITSDKSIREPKSSKEQNSFIERIKKEEKDKLSIVEINKSKDSAKQRKSILPNEHKINLEERDIKSNSKSVSPYTARSNVTILEDENAKVYNIVLTPEPAILLVQSDNECGSYQISKLTLTVTEIPSQNVSRSRLTPCDHKQTGLSRSANDLCPKCHLPQTKFGPVDKSEIRKTLSSSH